MEVDDRYDLIVNSEGYDEAMQEFIDPADAVSLEELRRQLGL